MRAVKLPFKILHQIIALSINVKLVENLSFRLVRECWPEGNGLGLPTDIQFRGLVIAKIRVPPDKLLVQNDVPLGKRDRLKNGKHIPLKESECLFLANLMWHEEKTTSSFDTGTQASLKGFESAFKKIKYLAQNTQEQKGGVLSCYVNVKLSGHVVVVDGRHRLFATILRDKNIDNMNIYVAI